MKPYVRIAHFVFPTLLILTLAFTAQVVPVQAADGVLTEGYYEQDDPNILYSGTWDEQAHEQDSGGTAALSWDKSATVTFSIDGDTLTLIRQTGPDFGTQQVCIDDVCQEMDNNSPEWKKRQPVTFGGLGGGVHKVDIHIVSGPSDIDAIQVDHATALPDGLHEETSGDLVFTGDWQEQTHDQFSNGTSRLTWDTAARLWFRFTGDTLTLIRQTGPNFGTFEVCIDDACQEMSNNSPEWLKRQPVTFGDLGSGEHIAEIREQSGTNDIDAIQVDSAGVLSEGLYEETSADLVFTGNWQEQIQDQYSGGSARLTVDKAAGLWFRFTGDTLTLIRQTGPGFGTFEVCIDDACQDVDNSSEKWTKRQPVTFGELGSREHTVTIRAMSGTNDIDAIQVNGRVASDEETGGESGQPGAADGSGWWGWVVIVALVVVAAAVVVWIGSSGRSRHRPL
jgi:hypothetical protein